LIADDTLTKRNLTIMIAAQAVLGAQMPMLFIVAGLAGQSFSTNICWATLPISLIVFGSMTTAPWLSSLMQNYGRRLGFIIGTLGGAVGGLLGAYALFISSFPLFLLASYFTGIYMSAQAFLRFAAIDTASEEFRPKAISYLMAAGLIPAIVGPQLVKLTSDAYVVPFMGVYLSVVAINLIGSLLFLFLKIPLTEKLSETNHLGRSRLKLLQSPKILVSIICAMVSYALMNLVMTSTPLAVVGCGYSQSNAADIVMMHVLGMFIPSFFTGHLIARYGAPRIVSIGLIILGGAGISNIVGVELVNFYIGLILLGIGWNFGFIGATTMLALAHEPNERGSVQGMNDFFVFGFVTIASLASGSLMNCSGGTSLEGWTSVNIAMLPFLILAGGSLVWISKQKNI
jgi:MFS family permease|tara:strand:- start:7582 stop:8781 length:1200 start_codon:yes stop_codon:yes gene_type:complete